MSYIRQQSPSRNFDKLEQVYNQEAEHNWNDERKKKNLYYRIVQLEKSNLEERRRMERELKGKEDEKLKDFWKADRERYLDEQRRKKNQIDEVRHANKSMSMEIMNASKAKEEFIPNNDYNEFCYEQFINQKKQQEEFLRNAEELERIRKDKERHNKNLEQEIFNKKKQEEVEYQRKREAEFKRIREKHQQNFSAYNYLDEQLKNKEREEQMLSKIIVNKGENDQQAKLLAKRLEFEAQEQKRKQNYIRELKGQLDSQQQRSYFDHRNQIQSERNMIEQRNRYFSEVEQLNKLRKSHENREMLDVLKGQVKPRKLLADPEAPEKVGLGSPVNIGKVMGDDRKRQLDWIEKSLLREIHY